MPPMARACEAATNAQAFHGYTPELLALRAEVRAHVRLVADLLREQAEVQAELAVLLAGAAPR